MRIALVGPPDHPQLRRLAGAFGVTRIRHADVVHVFASVPEPGPLSLVRPLLLTPLFGPQPLSWWARRFDRLVLPSQEEARRWTPHIPLGRIVVVETEDPEAEVTALRAIYGETLSMARRRR